MTDTLDRFSVLITAYKNAELVKQCVDSMLKVFGDRLPETVIVDDAAGDGPTRALAESYAKYGVKFAVMPQNGGFAGANNFGYPLCTKEFVVLVNSDIVFREDSFSPLIAFMDGHPKAWIAQGELIIKNGQPGVDGKLNGCGAFLDWTCLTHTPGWLKEVGDPVSECDTPHPCFAAYGAFFMVRNGIHEKIGGHLFYDFFHTYYEEVDLCHRTWLAGGEVWYVPTPLIEHRHGATMSRFYTRENVLKKFYRNQRFSFLTCYGLRGLFTIYPVYEFLALGQWIVQLLRGKGVAFRAHFWAVWKILGMLPTVWRTRRQIQKLRTLSDSELFRKVKRPLPFSEFMKMVRGNV